MPASRTPSLSNPARRVFLGSLPAWTLAVAAGVCPLPSHAEQPAAADPPAAQPFDFDALTRTMRERAGAADPEPPPLGDFAAKLTYDEYQMIRFPPKNARWSDAGSSWRMIPFHIGWLFKQPVKLYEVVDGQAREMSFSAQDFDYGGKVRDLVPPDYLLPGVAGFKLNHPLNRPDIFDEVISFIGASYFRALGQSNLYGLSARGLAIDTGMSRAEEFPRFSAFWLERPAPEADKVTIYAALDSASVTGAYRFVIRPGVDTVVEVTARLNFRAAVDQLGLAPLTSMFLFAGVNRQHFDDYRPEVHDSDGLRIERADGDVIWRALMNPAAAGVILFRRGTPPPLRPAPAAARLCRLRRPRGPLRTPAFGRCRADRRLGQGQRAAGRDPLGSGSARQHRRLLGSRGETGGRRQSGDLLPAALGRPVTARPAGSRRWSTIPDRASAAPRAPKTRRSRASSWWISEGGMLAQLPAEDQEVKPVVTLSAGNADVVTLAKVAGQDMWRLVMDISSQPGEVVELSAHVAGYGRKLSEIWMFQWVKP